MEATLSYGRSWLRDRQPPTGAPLWNALVVSDIGANSGTNLQLESSRWVQEHWMRNATAQHVTNLVETATPAQDLQRIRDILTPGMSTLANIFGVSRQTIYNWLNGEQPRGEHIVRLRDLAEAAEIFAEADIPITGDLLKRPVLEGKNLFEVARTGASAKNAARLIVQIVRLEAGQRARMAERFAGRRISSRSVESDFPAENDIR